MAIRLKEILKQKVLHSRQQIKDAVINKLIECLKAEMNDVAERGETSGSIYVNNECPETDLDELERILKLEEVTFGRKQNIYNWIFEEIRTNKIFEGIDFQKNDYENEVQEDKIQFNWRIDE